MSLLTNFKISSVLNTVNRSMFVSVTTTFPWDGHDRDEIGIALFYSNDDFVTNSGDLSNSEDGWSIADITTGIYSIRAYIVPVWTAGSYGDGSIVFYSNRFWINNSGGSTSTVPSDFTTDWTELTVSDHSEFVTNLYSGSEDYGYTDTEENVDVDLYVPVQTDSAIWTIDTYQSTVVRDYTIKTYAGIEVTTGIIAITDTDFEVDLTAQIDGPYIVEIVDTVYGTVNLVLYKITEFSICSKSLIDSILAWPVNPCQDCTDIDTQRRDMMNMLIAYSSYLFSWINIESISYIGIYTIDETRQSYITKVGEYCAKLNEIVENCNS